jgi:hypothetical protein
MGGTRERISLSKVAQPEIGQKWACWKLVPDSPLAVRNLRHWNASVFHVLHRIKADSDATIGPGYEGCAGESCVIVVVACVAGWKADQAVPAPG